MDVIRIIFICSAFIAVMTQESEENSTDFNTTIEPIVTTALPLNCTTAHSLEGICIARTSCDYGTPSIDQTLYKPSWYKSLCAPEEVCCPIDSLIPRASESQSDNGGTNTSVSPDDDDNF